MPGSVPGFRVSDTTTLKDLRHYLNDDVSKKDRRLIGVKENGQTVLYVSDKRASLLDRISGRAAERRANARRALGEIFERHEKKVSDRGVREADRDIGRTLFQRVSARLGGNTRHALRTRDVLNTIEDVRDVTRAIKSPEASPPVAAGPRLERTGLKAADYARFATPLFRLDEPNDVPSQQMIAFADGLGALMAKGLEGATPAEREAFALSDGAGLRAELKAEFMARRPEGSLDDDHLDFFVARAFNTAAAIVSPDHTLPNTENTALPPIEVGGKVYTYGKLLAKGGYGEAHRYTAEDGSSIVLKVAIFGKASLEDLKMTYPGAPIDEKGQRLRNNFPERDVRTRAVAEEARTHRSVAAMATQGEARVGHENVIGYAGAVRMPDGRIGVAMEFAPGGTLTAMSEKIDKAVGTTITAAQAEVLKLTLVKDTATGLDHMHGKGVTHFDFKGLNALVGADGHSKVSDFGTGRAEKATKASEILDNANVYWQSPEMLYAKERYGQVKRAFNKVGESRVNEVRGRMQALFGKTDSAAALASRVSAARDRSDLRRLDTAMAVDRSVDTWALGISAAMMFGVTLATDAAEVGGEARDILQDFGRTGAGRALQPAKEGGGVADGALGVATGKADVDELLDGMLAPTPGARSTLSAVIESPALNRPGVGSDAAHLLIAGLISGDADDIAFAKEQLGRLGPGLS